jgi:hypothetical protein
MNLSQVISSEPFHIFGGDLVLSAKGDLLLVSGQLETNQRIVRRLFTNAGANLWNLAYGAGLPSQVGLKANKAAITAIIRSQMFAEGTVAQVPLPTVGLTINPTGIVICDIGYIFAPTLQAAGLSVPLVTGVNVFQIITGLGFGLTTGSGQQLTIG